jgi:hypothetical protein
LASLHARERQDWVRLGLIELDLDSAQGWLEQTDVELTERERDTLAQLVEVKTAGVAQILRALDLDELPSTAAARRRVAEELLNRLRTEREALVRRVQAKVRGGRRKRQTH